MERPESVSQRFSNIAQGIYALMALCGGSAATAIVLLRVGGWIGDVQLRLSDHDRKLDWLVGVTYQIAQHTPGVILPPPPSTIANSDFLAIDPADPPAKGR